MGGGTSSSGRVVDVSAQPAKKTDGIPVPGRPHPGIPGIHDPPTLGDDLSVARLVTPVVLDHNVTKKYTSLSQHGKVQAEYVWIDSDYWDGKSFDLCCKTLTLDSVPGGVSETPSWSYSGDGGQEFVMVPRRIYKDPFRGGENIIVLTDTYAEPVTDGSSTAAHGDATAFNARAGCAEAMAAAEAMGEDPWFGFEQEYYLLDAQTSWPLGWPARGYPDPTVAYFCSVGATKVAARDVVEAHYRACLYAGVQIGGVNSEVAPAQWEFQVGPGSGVQAADDLWMSRYILQRLCEEFSVGVTFDPKPVKGWAGIGCHTNYSNNATRARPGGLDAMKEQIALLQRRHSAHMAEYGIGNERRLTGEHDAPSMSDFNFGVADRKTSIRISTKCAVQDCGWYEDRRPAANMDPYTVARLLVETTLLGGSAPHAARPKVLV